MRTLGECDDVRSGVSSGRHVAVAVDLGRVVQNVGGVLVSGVKVCKVQDMVR